MADGHGVPLALIVIDTMAAAAGFTDENDNAEGQKVMTFLGALSRADRGGCPRHRPLREGRRERRAWIERKGRLHRFHLALLGEREDNGKVSDSRLVVRKLK